MVKEDSITQKISHEMCSPIFGVLLSREHDLVLFSVCTFHIQRGVMRRRIIASILSDIWKESSVLIVF